MSARDLLCNRCDGDGEIEVRESILDINPVYTEPCDGCAGTGFDAETLALVRRLLPMAAILRAEGVPNAAVDAEALYRRLTWAGNPPDGS